MWFTIYCIISITKWLFKIVKYSTILVSFIIRFVIPLQNFIERILLYDIIIATDLYLPCSLFPLGDHLIMMNQLTVLHTDVHVIKGGFPMKDTSHLLCYVTLSDALLWACDSWAASGTKPICCQKKSFESLLCNWAKIDLIRGCSTCSTAK